MYACVTLIKLTCISLPFRREDDMGKRTPRIRGQVEVPARFGRLMVQRALRYDMYDLPLLFKSIRRTSSGTVRSWGWYRQESVTHEGVLGQKSDSGIAPFAVLYGSLANP